MISEGKDPDARITLPNGQTITYLDFVERLTAAVGAYVQTHPEKFEEN